MALSPDGTRLVYVANLQLYLREMDQLEAAPIRGTDLTPTTPFFSPDGQWVGFYADGNLRKVSVTGGAPVTLCEAANPWGASWGADDTIVFGQGPEGILRVSANGGTPEVIISMDSDKNELGHGPQMLPDGKTLLFTLRTSPAWDESQIVTQSLETGERRILIEGGRDARYVPTGHLVYALEETLLALPFDVARLEATGGPVPVVEGVRRVQTATGAAQASFSASGSLAYVLGGAATASREFVWVDREGREEPVAAVPQDYGEFTLSPDGTQVAVRVYADNADDVWIHDLVRNTQTRLTFDPAGRLRRSGPRTASEWHSGATGFHCPGRLPTVPAMPSRSSRIRPAEIQMPSRPTEPCWYSPIGRALALIWPCCRWKVSAPRPPC